MRHGEKDGDQLTERGRRQVAASFRAHCGNAKIHEIYCSPLQRASQTGKVIGKILGFHSVIIEEGFGANWLSPEPEFPGIEEAHRNLIALAGGKQPTPNNWLHGWPRAWELRGRFIGDMIAAANSVCIDERGSEETPQILICSHDPLIALAADQSIRSERIGFADIVRYTISFERTEAGEIVDSTLLRCP